MIWLAKVIPSEVWIGLGIALLAFGAYWKITSDAEQRGAATIVNKVQKEQSRAQTRAETERRKLDGGDRGRMREFDRD